MEPVAQHSGFSLLELMIVIIVIAIIGGLSLRFASNSENITKLYTQADLLLTDIRRTQSLAISRGRRFSLIKQSSTTYQIQDASGNIITNPLGESTTTLLSNITFGTFQTITSKITFGTNGVPYQDDSSSSALTTNAIIPLTLGDLTVNLTIAPETGNVSR